MSGLTFILLSLAAWRTWALLARDLLLDRVRDRLAPAGTKRRDWLECPYCSGFWHAAVWVSAWELGHDGSWWRWAAEIWAAATIVVLIEIAIDKATE